MRRPPSVTPFAEDPDQNYFVNTEAEREARGQGATSAVAPLGPQARSNAVPRASQPAECSSSFGQGPNAAKRGDGTEGWRLPESLETPASLLAEQTRD
jgi:hypothetical protein